MWLKPELCVFRNTSLCLPVLFPAYTLLSQVLGGCFVNTLQQWSFFRLLLAWAVCVGTCARLKVAYCEFWKDVCDYVAPRCVQICYPVERWEAVNGRNL